jgi:hypothetical protein
VGAVRAKQSMKRVGPACRNSPVQNGSRFTHCSSPSDSNLASQPDPIAPSAAPIPLPSLLNTTSQISIMSGIVRNKAAGGAGAQQQPPRPPNAWILYRSDKLQELPPPPLGHPKPTQAEVSKIISAQWRAEAEDVRALYEQRAEMAKAEHARLYPNYRFAPMKKADKDRIREEKRQAKEQERAGRRVRGRVAPYPPPSTAPTFKASIPLSIKHVFPDASSTSPLSTSTPSPRSSTTSPSQSCVGVVPCYGSARVSPDASIDPELPPVKSQTPSSHESFRLAATVPPATPLPVVPPRLMLDTPQPTPPKGWQPSPSDSPTTFPTPPEELSLPDWPQTLPQLTQVPHEACILSYSLPPQATGVPNIIHRLATFISHFLVSTLAPCRIRRTSHPLRDSSTANYLAPSRCRIL